MVKSFYTNIINPNLGTDSPSSNVTNPMGATLDMGGNYIINTAQANQSNGVPTLSQVQALITAGGGGGGGGWVPTATSDLNMNSHSITNLASVILVGTEESNQLLMDTGLLSITRDGLHTVGHIYDSFYNRSFIIYFGFINTRKPYEIINWRPVIYVPYCLDCGYDISNPARV